MTWTPIAKWIGSLALGPIAIFGGAGVFLATEGRAQSPRWSRLCGLHHMSLTLLRLHGDSGSLPTDTQEEPCQIVFHLKFAVDCLDRSDPVSLLAVSMCQAARNQRADQPASGLSKASMPCSLFHNRPRPRAETRLASARPLGAAEMCARGAPDF